MAGAFGCSFAQDMSGISDRCSDLLYGMSGSVPNIAGPKVQNRVHRRLNLMASDRPLNAVEKEFVVECLRVPDVRPYGEENC